MGVSAERDRSIPLKMPPDRPVITIEEFVLLNNDNNIDDAQRELLYYRLIEAAVYAEEEVVIMAGKQGLAKAYELYGKKLTPIYRNLEEIWPKLRDDVKRIGKPTPLLLVPRVNASRNTTAATQ